MHNHRFAPQDLDPTGYYWTHGYKVAVGHNSRNCGGKYEGHKRNATRSNPVGGSQMNED